MGWVPRLGIQAPVHCGLRPRLLARQRERQDPRVRVHSQTPVVLLYARSGSLYGVVRDNVD